MDTCESSNYNFIKINCVVSQRVSTQLLKIFHDNWESMKTWKLLFTQNLEKNQHRKRHETAEHHQWSQKRSPSVLEMLRFMQWIQLLFSWDSHVQTAPEHHWQGLEKQLFGSLRFCRPGVLFSCLHLGIWNNFEILCHCADFQGGINCVIGLVPAENYLRYSMASQNALINHLHIDNYHSHRPPLTIAGACTPSSQAGTHTDSWIWVSVSRWIPFLLTR